MERLLEVLLLLQRQLALNTSATQYSCSRNSFGINLAFASQCFDCVILPQPKGSHHFAIRLAVIVLLLLIFTTILIY